jgi:CheY-like chemotaxis protein
MTQHGYRTSVTHEGRTMMQILESARIDLVVLGESGLSLCRRIRSSSSIPIIMLTAVGSETDRIVGLKMGRSAQCCISFVRADQRERSALLAETFCRDLPQLSYRDARSHALAPLVSSW